MTAPTDPSPVSAPPSVLDAVDHQITDDDPVNDPEPTPQPGTSASSSPLAGFRPSLGLVVASLLSLFVFALLNWPEADGWSDLGRPLLFLDTTPSGGDMGAHVWGPAFLRDHLLTSGRLSGWTPDWYAGFPAFHFYMVVPALAIIAVNTGLPWFLGIPAAGLVLFGARRLAGRSATGGRWIMAAAVLVAVLLIGVPYGVAFKLVSVSGLRVLPARGLGHGPAGRGSLADPGAGLARRVHLPVRHQLHHLRRQRRLDPGRGVRLLDQPLPQPAGYRRGTAWPRRPPLAGPRRGHHRSGRPVSHHPGSSSWFPPSCSACWPRPTLPGPGSWPA